MDYKQNTKIATLLAIKDIDFINEEINKGKYLSRSDFIRQAVREKIKSEKE